MHFAAAHDAESWLARRTYRARSRRRTQAAMVLISFTFLILWQVALVRQTTLALHRHVRQHARAVSSQVRSTISGHSADFDFTASGTPTFVVTCATQWQLEDIRALIASFLVLTSGPLRLVFLSPAHSECVPNLKGIFTRNLTRSRYPLRVEIHHIENRTIDDWGATLRVDVGTNGVHGGSENNKLGRWAFANMMTPWLITRFTKVITIDSDIVLLEDPYNLWKLFNSGAGGGVSVGGDANHPYIMPISESGHVVSSSLVLIDFQRVREENVYPHLFRQVLTYSVASEWYKKKTELFQPPNADQGLYWLLSSRYPDLFAALPREWSHALFSHAVADEEQPVGGLLHRPSATAQNNEMGAMFDYFQSYDWKRLNPPKNRAFTVDLKVFHTSMMVPQYSLSE